MTGSRDLDALERRWKILVHIGTARLPVTRRDLARKFEVDKKTIGRDVDFLIHAGFDIQHDDPRNGERTTYWAGKGFKMPPPVAFRLPELAAIQLARAQLVQLAGAPYDPDLDSACAKIAALLPKEAVKFYDSMTKLALVQIRGAIRTPPDRQVVATLTSAISEPKPCRIVYSRRGRTEQIEMEIEPQQMLVYEGGLYAIVWSRAAKDFRTLAVERISRIEPLAGSFIPRPKKRIEREYGQAFGLFTGKPFTFKVRFAPEIAPFIAERTWHPTEKIEKAADGSIVISAKVSGPLEVEAWVLRYGARAELLEPEWLRERVAEQVREMARIYSSGA